MPTLPKELGDLLAHLGVSEQSFQWIKFGGVVGKLALVILGIEAVMIVVAMRAATGMLLWGCLVAGTIVGLVGIIAIAIHALKNPLEATLEGGQIVALKQIQSGIALKGQSVAPDAPRIEGSSKPDVDQEKTGDA